MESERSNPCLPESWRRVRLVVIQPRDYCHTKAMNDMIGALRDAFVSLGAEADIAENRLIGPPGRNILFHGHLLDRAVEVPPGTVIFNAEQLNALIFTRQERFSSYLNLLGRQPVWDYSHRNAGECRRALGNDRVHVLKLGYVPGLSRIDPAPVQDVDVLFYGSVNPRRRAVLASVAAGGVNVKCLFGVYGAERDAWIARSRIVINIHFYEDQVHEIVRSSYLLANRKAVVTELDERTEIDEDLKEAMVCAPYDGLAAACLTLARDDARRRAVEERGFAVFSRRRQEDALLEAILATP